MKGKITSVITISKLLIQIAISCCNQSNRWTRKRPNDLVVKFPINNTHGNFGHYSEGLHTPTIKLSCVSGAYLTRCVHTNSSS
jgi:hypothetical protein